MFPPKRYFFKSFPCCGSFIESAGAGTFFFFYINDALERAAAVWAPAQAERLWGALQAAGLSLDVVIEILLPRPVAKGRIMGRRICTHDPGEGPADWQAQPMPLLVVKFARVHVERIATLCIQNSKNVI